MAEENISQKFSLKNIDETKKFYLKKIFFKIFFISLNK